MMIGIVRRSVLDAWWPTYMKEVHHVHKTDWIYIVTVWGLAITGIIGGFSLGWASDRVFGSRRAPVVCIGFVGVIAVLGTFLGLDALKVGPVGAAVSIMLLSFFINGARYDGAWDLPFLTAAVERAARTASGSQR